MNISVTEITRLLKKKHDLPDFVTLGADF